jgi:2-methylisocitrate lyase-like PEP mutase family enzyme
MQEKSKGQRLKELIAAPELLMMHAVYDGYSVRLVEKFGYQAAFVSGAALSESNLGLPDVGLMGMEENLSACRRLAKCCNLALLADCDTGYGNAVNVYHMVQAFEQAGVAGIMIEDQQWPKRCGHMQGKSVVDASELVEKIQAAAEARQDPSLVIKSRTDSFGTHGLDEAIRRLNLYHEAGADLLFADALATEEDIRTVVKNIPGPLCVNMGFAIRKRSTTELISARRLHELGVSVVMYGRMLGASAIQGLKNSLAAFEESLKEDKVTERPELLVSFEELNEIMGLGAVKDLEQRFVKKAKG